MNAFSRQRTLAMMAGFEGYTKKTRRAMFLEEMEQVVPWGKLCALIEPHYPRPGNGRRPKELRRKWRDAHCLLLCSPIACPVLIPLVTSATTVRGRLRFYPQPESSITSFEGLSGGSLS